MIFSINLKHILVYVLFPYLYVSDTSTISVIYLCVLIHVFHYSGFRNCGWRCHLYHLHWIYCSSSRNPIISPSAANKLWTHGWQKREDFSSDSTYFSLFYQTKCMNVCSLLFLSFEYKKKGKKTLDVCPKEFYALSICSSFSPFFTAYQSSIGLLAWKNFSFTPQHSVWKSCKMSHICMFEIFKLEFPQRNRNFEAFRIKIIGENR